MICRGGEDLFRNAFEVETNCTRLDAKAVCESSCELNCAIRAQMWGIKLVCNFARRYGVWKGGSRAGNKYIAHGGKSPNLCQFWKVHNPRKQDSDPACLGLRATNSAPHPTTSTPEVSKRSRKADCSPPKVSLSFEKMPLPL